MTEDLEKDSYVQAGKRFSKGGRYIGYGQGLSVRDYFATHVNISGMNVFETLALSGNKTPTVAELSKYAAEIKYIMADAMLVERNKND